MWEEENADKFMPSLYGSTRYGDSRPADEHAPVQDQNPTKITAFTE